jgi:hypothetical protein
MIWRKRSKRSARLLDRVVSGAEDAARIARAIGFTQFPYSSTLPELAVEDLGSFLASDTKDRFGTSHARLAEIIPFAARLALDCIGNGDALYHNVEHTMLVTLVGHEIFKGRALLMPVTPVDYSNFIVACLTHDIGYIRGIVKGDDAKGYIVDGTGRKISLWSPVLPGQAAMRPASIFWSAN